MTLTAQLGNNKSKLGAFKLGSVRKYIVNKYGVRWGRFARIKFGQTNQNFSTYTNDITFSTTNAYSTDNFLVATNDITFSTTNTFSTDFIYLLIEDLTFSTTNIFSDDVHRTTNQSGNNNLIWNQSASRQMTFNRTGSNILIFPPNFVQQSGVGGFTILVPNAQAFVVHPRQIALQSGSDTIILPTPRLGDGQDYSGGVVNIKYAIDGTLRTYIKRINLQKLKYTFWLGRYKSLELQRFLKNHIADPIYLTNWKGEYWYGYIINDPFDFTGVSRWGNEIERYDCTIEFEGTKLIG